MRGHLALVLLGSLISRTVSGGDLEPVRVGRYSAIVPGPSPEQADPLSVPVHRPLPLSVQTVGRAIEQVLAPTGYRLADLPASCPSLPGLLGLPLPAVHRRLGPMRLDEALKALAGPAHYLVVDPVHRLVSFELRERYASLVPVATLRAPVDAGKGQVPEGLAAARYASQPLLPQTAGRRRIGPIRQDAQLWPIAAELRRTFRATTEQLMVGLFEANPGSFCHRNLHCLKVGAYLKMPQATQVAAITASDAHRTVQRHLEVWRHRSRREAHGAEATPPRGRPMMRASSFLLATSLVSACSPAPVREEAPPMQPAALRAQPVCHPPEHLVRDLTVPWAARTYVVGPCPDKEANAASASPPVPVSSEIDLSASQRTAP